MVAAQIDHFSRLNSIRIKAHISNDDVARRWIGAKVVKSQPASSRSFLQRTALGPQRSRAHGQCNQSTLFASSDITESEEDGTEGKPAMYLRTVIPAALAMLLCNIDRICLSVAIVPLSIEMGWHAGVQGIIQSSFLWGYVATQLLGGALADKYGGKMVMKFGIVFFSISSVLLPLFAITPITKSLGLVLPAVLLSRFLVGFGEGVALPSINNIMAKNIPLSSRASAYGGMFTGFHSGNLVGLLLSPILIQQYGWRSLFYVFGALGIPLLYIWSLVVPNPRGESTNGAISKEGSTEPVSLTKMLQTKPVWAIITANIVNHWGYFIYLNWMPTYFYKVLGMDLRSSSFMSVVPWLLMACGSLGSGIFCDGLVRTGRNRTAVRKMIQTLALMGAVPGLLMLSTGSLTVGQSLFAMSMALGMTSLGQFTANISEVAPNHAGKLFGLSNTFGCISGIAGVSIAGFIVQSTGSFETVFLVTTALNVIGTIVWNLFASAEQQF
eukprot:jgi/Picsp_1/5050/NSC_02413-R1_probable anion transporter chloroplastic-like